MNKQEFEQELRSQITNLPETEIEKSVAYYMELLEDHMEDGASEEDAIQSLGTMEEIVKGIYCDQSLPTLVKAKVKEKKEKSNVSNVVLIVLTILGFPIWFPILAAIVSVIISFYTSIWSVIISLYAVVLSFGFGGVFGLVIAVISFFVETPLQALVVMGVSLCMISVSLFLIYPVFWISKGLVQLTGWVLKKIKSAFVKTNSKEVIENEGNI